MFSVKSTESHFLGSFFGTIKVLKGGYMKSLSILLVLVTFVGCATIYREEVVATMESREKPKWATLENAYFIEKDKVFYVGVTEAISTSRTSALLRVSDINARSEIAKEINNQINVVFQNIQEGIDDGGNFARLYSSEVSKFLSHGIKIEKRFWEKVYIQNPKYGHEVVTRAYSLLSIKRSSLRKPIKLASTKSTITRKMREILDKQIMNEIENNTSEF